MAEGRSTHVSYEAIAQFASLHKELRKTRQELAKTQAAEKAFNAASAKSYENTTKAFKESIKAQKEYNNTQDAVSSTTRKKTDALRKEATQLDRTRKANVRFVDSVGDVNTATGEVVESTEKATQATSRWASAMDRARQFMSRHTTETKNATAAEQALTRAKERQYDAAENLRISELRLADIMKNASQNAARVAAAELRVTRARRAVAAATRNVESAVKRLNDEGNKLPNTFRTVQRGGDRLFNSLQKFANWRPRLVPPFVALIPIIGAVIAAINPLIALMGSLGSVAIGLAGSIGSLSGAFLALPGILSGVAAGIAGVIASMGGVGNVFKTYAAMQKAANSGANTGKTQAERADELADAERNLSKAQRNVQKAQENLNKARQRALKDLIDLRLEVSRASLNEERAVANLRKAQEDYWNVLADPGSTLGDKLDAAASVKEAEADLQDVRKKNVENQKALTEAEKKGVKNSEAVLDAQENLADAYAAQRDAQRNLGKVQRGETSANIKAVNEYNQALAELSPSARKFVLAILAMEKQWKSFRREMQETFFSQFVDELDRLPNLLRNLRRFLLPSARAMGQFVRSFMILMDSPEWSSDLKTIGEQNATVIKNLGDGFLDLATALKDITIAAGPFTEWMTKGFAEGAENFKDFVGNARETGRLAAWLDKVAERMQKWWTVVKNVGLTIFNYSAAAEDFGGWLLDGFVNLSEGWRKASEEARKEGSPFQEYLENIKPLLSEVKGLFGDFFGWLRDEMMDPENIKDAQDLVKVIRDDLGPALGRLLDALAKTDIDEKFIEALSSIIDSIATIMENGGGDAFEAFFDIVEGFFEFLADVAENIPPEVLSAILKFVGGIAAFAFIGKFTGITSLLGAIMGFSGKNGLFASLSNMVKDFGKLDKMKFSALLGKAGLFAGIAAVALITWNQIQDTAPFQNKLGDAIANPSEKNVEEAKKEGIKDGNALKWATGPTNPLNMILTGGMGGINLGGISEVLSFIDDILGTSMSTEFDNFLEDIMVNLDNFSQDVANWFMTDFLPGWNGFWGQVKRGWETFWAPIVAWWDKNVSQPLQTAWRTLQNAFAYGIAWINTYVILPLRLAWARFAIWFDTTFVQPVKRKWQEFQTSLQKGWNWINQYVITPFKNGFNTLQTTLGKIVTGMGNKWNELKKKFADPVNFVIDSVYNNGIRSFWNGINKSLNLKLALPYVNRVKFADGGVMPNPNRRSYAYATGGVLPGYTPGRDVHDFVSPTGGRLSLSGGEAIMRPEFTKLMGGKKGIDELNKKARRGQAFANGGVFNGGTTQRFASGGVWEVAGDLWDKFSGFFGNPLKYVKEGIGNLVNPILKNIGGGDFGKILSAIPGRIIDGLAGFSKDKTKEAKRKSADITANQNGMKWPSMWAAVKKAFPSATLNSAYRNPLMNSLVGGASGSYHTRGRAIDVTPSAAIFNWIRQNYPNSRELIYSPMGGRQLQNGRNHYWGEPVRSDHWDHVHWAMKKGGVIPGLYDNGGWLPHGGLAVNRSGKPEAVLDPQESRALKALLSGSGLSARPSAFGATAATAVNAAPQVIDNSINIDNVTIQNPVPEKTSDSLPKAIRRIGYMNEARTR